MADEIAKGYLRLNHFHGLRLESEDFETGEKYHVDKRKLHNKVCHGRGVIPRYSGQLRVTARKRGDLDAASRAYKDLNRLALGRLAPGGLLLTWSCSGAVDAQLFRQILGAAAVEAGGRIALLAQLGAAADHPVAIAHPQGEYLKGWLALRR